MSPQEIQRLLTEACPELTWVIEGDRARAEGTKLHVATDPDWGEVSLWVGRGVLPMERTSTDSVGLRIDVWRALTKGEIKTIPGARLLDARMRAERARFDVEVQTAREEGARRELATRTATLAAAHATAAAAEAALAKAEVHAAKVGA